MRYLGLALVVLFTVASSGAGRAGEPTRFTPLKPDELAPPQKEWADAIAVPPRNAKFTNPPYRAYIRNPELAPKLSAMSDYLRWNSSLPARLRARYMNTLCSGELMMSAPPWTRKIGGVSFGTRRPGASSSLSLALR